MRTRRRKIWEKRISFLLVMIILVIILLQGLPKKITITDEGKKENDYYASSSQTRKIISLVYDDSASMSDQGNVNWAYANYAFQIFIGLLNPNDSLYVTYMSKPNVTNLLVDSKTDRQDSVTQARGHFRNSATPISAVTSAYNKLNTLGATTESVEYWLVIITDGYLQAAGTGAVLSSEYISEMVKDYSNRKLDNGEPLNVVYMGIGNEVAIISEDEDNKAIVKYANSSEEIITRMSEIAMEIGDWQLEMEGVTGKLINDTQAEITLRGGPLEKVAILIQGSDKHIKNVVRKDETGDVELHITQDLAVNYPEYPGCTTDEKLKGYIDFFTGPNNYLDIGTYIVTFDGDVVSDYQHGASIDMFLDSGLETRLFIYDEDQKKYVHTGESLSDQVLYTISTEAYITNLELPYKSYMEEKMGTRVNSEYSILTNNNDTLQKVDDYIIESAQYKAESLIVTSEITLQGITDVLKVNVPVKHAPIYATRISGTRGAIKRTNLVNRDFEMKIKIYHDDVVYMRKDIQNMRLNIDCSEKYVKVDTLVDTDGTITITPYFGNTSVVYKFFLGWLQSWLINPGANQIVLTFHDDTQKEAFVCKEAFTIKLESLPQNIWNHIKPFLFFLIIWGYTYKPRFSKNMRVYALTVEQDGNAYIGSKDEWVEMASLGIKKFLPYFTDVIVIDEGKIIADKEKDNVVKVKAARGWKITDIILREDTISKTRDVYIHTDSDRLMAVDTTELTTDESTGFIMRNELTNEYSLFLIRYSPIRTRER